MKIAFLGTGAMGAPIVRHLLASEHEIVVWNRSRERAEALAGVRVAPSAAAAVEHADVVMTSLFDDAAYEDVLFRLGVLEKVKRGALHISLSTISVALSDRLAHEHRRREQKYAAAPVFGRPNIAQDGKLWVVVAGEDDVVAEARPLLEKFSRGISIVGKEPRQAHALKLGGNFLISAMIHSLSESFVYAEAQGISAQVFLEAVNSALFQSPFYASYGKVMLNPPERPGAPIDLGAKDNRLFREAAESRKVGSSLADTLAEIFAAAQKMGLGSEDWAVGQYRMAQKRAPIA